MDNKKFLRTIWIVTGIILLGTTVPYIWHFSGAGISDKPDSWGQLGDYFGGLLNPIVSLLSLAVLTYISISVSKIEEKRNQFTLQEMARPLGQVICGDYEGNINIKFKNCGLGPLTIKSIRVEKEGKLISDSLIKLIPDPPNGIYWTDFIIDARDFVVAKDSEINIISLEGEVSNKKFAGYQETVRRTLLELTIEITYADIYDRPMPSAKRNLLLFGRTLNQNRIYPKED